jgi:peptidoglycan/LPS O-acetylase OafA/YrhL
LIELTERPSLATQNLSPRPTTSVARNPLVDTYRGLAILAVILYHISNTIIFPEGWGLARGADGAAHLASGSNVIRFLFLPFHMGRIGVNLFFVISGLCIHMRLATARTKNPNATLPIKSFFLKRFWRIYPVYWASLIIAILIGPYVFSAQATGHIGIPHFPSVKDVLAHVVMLHSFDKDYMMDIMAVYWSIATEEQFYLLYPLVFILIGRKVKTPQLVAALLVITVVWRASFVVLNPPPKTYYEGPFLVWVWGFSISRYFEWSLGALLAWAMAEKRTLAIFPGRLTRFLGSRPWLVVLMGIGLIFLGAASLARAQLKWMIEDPCYSMGWFLIMAATLLPAEGAQKRPADARTWRRFVTRPLAALGRRSFSIYLLHDLPLVAATAVMHRYGLPAFAGAMLALVLIWVVCEPFWAFVEVPFEKRSKAVPSTASAVPSAQPV